MTTAADVAAALEMAPHPEGGWYRETWRAAELVDVRRSGALVARNAGTSILYLLGAGQVSRFHRIRSDEAWYHHGGSPIAVHVLSRRSSYERMIVGPYDVPDASPQIVIPAGAWFAAELLEGTWALAGCAVAPGFDFDDFELADEHTLVSMFPNHADLIARLT